MSESLTFQLRIADQLSNVVRQLADGDHRLDLGTSLRMLDRRFGLDCSFILLKHHGRREVLAVSDSTGCKMTPFLDGKFQITSPTLQSICNDPMEWIPLRRNSFPDDRLWELLWQAVELGPYPRPWKICGRLLGVDSLQIVDASGVLIMIAPSNAADWDSTRRDEARLAASQISHVVELANSDLKLRTTVSELVGRLTSAGENILLHSIFSPLQRLELHAELAKRAQRKGDVAGLSRHLDTMRLNAWEASRFAKGMLDLGHPPEEIDQKSPEALQPKVVLDELVEHFRPFADVKAKDIVLRVETSDLLNIARADFEEIISNLVHNAIKYGHANTKIKLTVHSSRDHVMVDVLSYGILIPEDAHDKVFDIGFRTPEAARLEYNAVGFGLHRSRDLAKRWGKLYLLSSEPDTTYANAYRSVFRLRLPRR